MKINRHEDKQAKILMRYFLYLLLNFLLIFPYFISYANTYPIRLGDTRIFVIRQFVGKGKTLVHLHENEATALEAAVFYLNCRGGTLITLKHSGERNVVFYLKRRRYEFDPNRIFTDRGIKKSLKKFGSYSIAAHQEVQKLREKIIRLL